MEAQPGGPVSLAPQPTADQADENSKATNSRHRGSSEQLPPLHNHTSTAPPPPSTAAGYEATSSSPSSTAAAIKSSSPQLASSTYPVLHPLPPPTSVSPASSLPSHVVVNLPVTTPTPALSSPLTSTSSLSTHPAPSPHTSNLVPHSLPPLPPTALSVRGLISHVFLLRSDVWEVLERWSQMPQLDAARFAVSGSGAASPLAQKLEQKRHGIESGVRVMAELAQLAQLDRMERAKRMAGGAGGRGSKARTLIGYDGIMAATEQQQHQHQAADETNATLLANMRRISANTTHSMHTLTDALQSAFPSVHANLADLSSSSSTASFPSAPSLEGIINAALRRCHSLYGSGAGDCAVSSGGALWYGMHVSRVVSASPSFFASSTSSLSSSSPSLFCAPSVLHLVVSLPAVMRVHVCLSDASHPHGPLHSVRVLSWDEELLCTRHSLSASHPSTATFAHSHSPPHPRSAYSLSSRSVMALVQAQLTAQLHRCNSLLPLASSLAYASSDPTGSFPFSSSSSYPSSSYSSSSSATHPFPFSSSSSSAVLRCPLFHFLVHVASYHSLFTAPCVCCGELLNYHDDTVKLLPPVVRTVGVGVGVGVGQVSSAAVHATCLHALHSDMPQQQGSGSGSGSSSGGSSISSSGSGSGSGGSGNGNSSSHNGSVTSSSSSASGSNSHISISSTTQQLQAPVSDGGRSSISGVGGGGSALGGGGVTAPIPTG